MTRLPVFLLCGVALTSCAHATTPPLLPAANDVLATAPDANGYKQLYSFGGNPRGSAPMSSLTPFSGALYGTTTGGGAKTFGTIFVRASAGNVRVLYSFKGGSDGATPDGKLLVLGGALYGTTEYGGSAGDGTVFRSSSTGSESVVHSFKGGSDGATPLLGGLVAAGGKLYGTTNAGGDSKCHVMHSTGCGVVFQLTTERHGTNPASLRRQARRRGSVGTARLRRHDALRNDDPRRCARQRDGLLDRHNRSRTRALQL